MDLATLFRIIFVVGIVAIPILYWLLGGRSVGRDQDRTRKEGEHAEREHPSKQHGTSARATE